MPIIKSAKKRAKQTKTRTEKNKALKNTYKTKIIGIKKGVGVLDAKKLNEKISEAYKAIDKAAKRNVIHKNKAARKKSQVARLAKEGKKAKKKSTVKKKPAV